MALLQQKRPSKAVVAGGALATLLVYGMTVFTASAWQETVAPSTAVPAIASQAPLSVRSHGPSVDEQTADLRAAVAARVEHVVAPDTIDRAAYVEIESAPDAPSLPETFAVSEVTSDLTSERAETEERRLSPSERRAMFRQLRTEALSRFRAHRFAQAAAAYRRATRLNPRHAGSFAGLGASELAMGHARRAVRAYRRSVLLAPANAGFHAALGHALVSSGQRRQARASLQRALRINPSHRGARAGLARLHG